MTRYDKYKDSGIEWIGEIPEEWEVKRGKVIFENKKELNNKLQCDDRLALTLRGVIERPQNDNVGLSPADFRTYQIFDENNLVFKLIDLENYNTSRVGYVFKKGIMSSAYIRLINKQKIDVKYFYYQYYDLYLRRVFNFLGTGVRATLSAKELLNIPVVIPPFETQLKLARYIDKKQKQSEKFILKQNKIIDLLKEQKKAIINKAVTKGINPNVKMKDSGVEWLGEIPEHWEISKMKYLSIINPAKSNTTFSKNSEENACFLPMENVSEDGMIDTSIKKPIKELWEGLTYFEKNDVIMAKITPCFENGKGAYLDKLDTQIGFGSTEFHTIRASKKILPKFIFYIVRTSNFKKMGEENMVGTAGQKRVPTEFLANYLVALPSKREQQEIIAFIEMKLRKIDIAISKAEQEVKLAKEYMESLIFNVVTGQIKVD